MSEITEERWTYDEHTGCVYDDRNLVAIVSGANDSIYSYKRGKANARLIAAAPELCKLVKEELIPTSDYGGILSFSREAKIRKVLDYIDGKENTSS